MAFYLFAQAVANSIAALALVVIPFAVFGRWPPRELLLCSTLGGASSPFAWRAYRGVRGYMGRKTEKGDTEPESPENGK